MEDRKFMEIALKEGAKGIGHVNPNPLVGAVIVKDGTIISKGYHESYGGLHAERNAIKNANEDLSNSTMYVTLEPCCHYGKTPPCTEAIIESGIKKVIVATLDPNSLVSGKGVEILKNAGIEVVVGVMEEEAKRQNEVFFHYIKYKKPFVTMKYAMTIDGKIASRTGDSKWISSEKSREGVHRDRNKYSAIMVGIGTVISDNPMLNCRIEKGRNPIRIICDTKLITPLDSKIVKSSKEIRTIIATNNNRIEEHINYIENGCEILYIPKKENHIDLNFLMNKLGNMGIDSIYLEGGGSINFSALEEKIVNKIMIYISPKIIGGDIAKSPIGGLGFEKIVDSIKLKYIDIKKIEEDILIESEVLY